MYEYYQVDGFSFKWTPNKFEYSVTPTGNLSRELVSAPSFCCLDPEEEFPQTPS